MQIAWHQGHPLSQTLLTSLHLNNLLRSESVPLEQLVFQTHLRKPSSDDAILVFKVLRAYCLAIVKCCDLAIREIMSEHFYEEEDFVTQTFTIDLLAGCESDQIDACVGEAIEILPAVKVDEEMLVAIRDRLTLVRDLLRAFDPDASIDTKRDSWRQAALSLEAVKLTHSRGQPVPDAFSERVQRYLASTTPPRPRIETSWSEAVSNIDRMCRDNIEAHDLAELLPSPSPHALLVSSRKTAFSHPADDRCVALRVVLQLKNSSTSHVLSLDSARPPVQVFQYHAEHTSRRLACNRLAGDCHGW